MMIIIPVFLFILAEFMLKFISIYHIMIFNTGLLDGKKIKDIVFNGLIFLALLSSLPVIK